MDELEVAEKTDAKLVDEPILLNRVVDLGWKAVKYETRLEAKHHGHFIAFHWDTFNASGTVCFGYGERLIRALATPETGNHLYASVRVSDEFSKLGAAVRQIGYEMHEHEDGFDVVARAKSASVVVEKIVGDMAELERLFAGLRATMEAEANGGEKNG